MFSFKPDYETAKARIDAFWECEIIDRPIVQFGLAKPEEERLPLPVSGHPSPEARWMDGEYQAELKVTQLANREFMAETMPVMWPNLGPEILAGFYGCPIRFGDYGTSWTEPILHDWDQVDQIQFDPESPYLKALHEHTDLMLEVGAGKCITGMTDWHPGGDGVAALREPQELAMDLLLHREQVVALLDRLEKDYLRIYDVFYEKLRAAGQPISTWTSLVCNERYYVPSNDFSIMISKEMFDEVFLPGIVRECQFLARSIYHLDGPGALRHLDSLLDIPELDALQWVPGAGNEGFHRWVEVYQRAQAAGKAIQVICQLDELDLITETLRPEGVFLSMGGVPDREAGQAMLCKLEKWCLKGV